MFPFRSKQPYPSCHLVKTPGKKTLSEQFLLNPTKKHITQMEGKSTHFKRQPEKAPEKAPNVLELRLFHRALFHGAPLKPTFGTRHIHTGPNAAPPEKKSREPWCLRLPLLFTKWVPWNQKIEVQSSDPLKMAPPGGSEPWI